MFSLVCLKLKPSICEQWQLRFGKERFELDGMFKWLLLQVRDPVWYCDQYLCWLSSRERIGNSRKDTYCTNPSRVKQRFKKSSKREEAQSVDFGLEKEKQTIGEACRTAIHPELFSALFLAGADMCGRHICEMSPALHTSNESPYLAPGNKLNMDKLLWDDLAWLRPIEASIAHDLQPTILEPIFPR